MVPPRDPDSAIGKIFSALHNPANNIHLASNNGTRCYLWKCKSEEFYGKECKFCLPTVFVAGFSKCGTTALCSKLILHPEIKQYRKKEINIWTKFFDEFSWDKFEKRVLDTNPKRIGHAYLDCTASAFRDFNSLAYLMKFSPTTKFIFMVRDPFQRLASWLLMFKRALPSRKYERFYRVWMSALRKSQYSKRERFDSLVIRRLMRKERYISSFLYAEVLLHWIAGISTDRILVLDHYDLEERPLEVMRMIESYLSLPPHHYDDSDLLSVSVNTGVAPEDDDGRLLADQKEKRSGSQSSNLRLLSQSLNLSHFFSSSGDGNTTRANPIHPPYVITDTQLLALSRHLFWPSLCLFERVFGWSIHITTESEL